MKKTQWILLTGITIVAAATVAMVINNPFSQIKNSYFEPDDDKLRQVPANLLVVRPTHFSHDFGKVSHYHNGDSLARTVGRNVSFQHMMAEANGCDFAQVILPPGTPQGHFDFLVTRAGRVRQQLRTAIQKELGYTAHQEMRETDVLILTVSNPALPGLTTSADGETSDASFKDGQLHFTHKSMDTIVGGLEQGLNIPILDQTGLTNHYDFSLPWNANAQKVLENGKFDLGRTRTFLAGWGLDLEATNIPMEMYVVTRAH